MPYWGKHKTRTALLKGWGDTQLVRLKKNQMANNGQYAVTKQNIRKGILALKKVKRLESQEELKYMQSSNTLIANNAGNVPASLIATLPVQALGDFNSRIGDQISLKNLYINGYFKFPTGTTTAANYRIIIIKDKKNALTLANQVLPATYLGTAFATLGFKLFDSKEEVKFLKDECFTVNQIGVQGQYCFQWKIPLNYNVTFNATGTAPDLNDLKIMVVADDAPAPTNVNFYYVWRITYKDS